jgi:sugar/nucleoside kinase (ribokinase family)
MKKGIAFAGNLIVDYVKIIDYYPVTGMLANIRKVSKCIGGSAANTSVDIAQMDCSIPVKCIGMVGNDVNGQYIISVLQKYGIDTSYIKVHEKLETSFTDVMTVKDTGERTFFHARGANAKFSFEHIDFDNINADIFHIGYALLLDSFDAEDKEYGTVMAKTLAKVKEKGIKTSMDVVSENSDRFKKIIAPSLKYCDFLIINEVEASLICDIPVRNNENKIVIKNIVDICKKLLEMGVNEKVIIHFPEAGWYMDKGGKSLCIPSLELPRGYIKGTVGAGDAFCAGMLYSIYKEFDPELSLRLASNAAAANLSEKNSIDGMRPFGEIMLLEKQYKRKQNPVNTK